MRIYIPEHIPSGNKGEEAILQGISEGLKQQGKQARISVFSYTPATDKTNLGNEFEVIDGISFRAPSGKPMLLRVLESMAIWLKHSAFLLLWRLFGRSSLSFFRGGNWKAYVDADIILVGHDGMLSDINILFTLFVKGLGKKSAIFGCGFRTFRFRLTEKLASFVIPMMDLVVLREEHAYQYLLSIGIPEKKMCAKPDPAFLMQPAHESLVEEVFQRENIHKTRKPLIGMIAVIGHSYYKHFYGIMDNGKNRYEKHTEFFAEMTETIIEITCGTVVFIPHCVQLSRNRDDRVVARDIKRKIGKYDERVILIENEYSAPVLKGLIQRLDFLVSMRLHAVIGAATVGTPFMMITVKEDQRAYQIVGKTLGRPDLLFDINKPEMRDFCDKFREKWIRRDEIQEYLVCRAEDIVRDSLDASRLLAQII